MTRILKAEKSRSDTVLRILTAAFASDPLMRWFLPEDRVYQTAFPALTMAFAGQAFTLGSACISECERAAALWLAPDISPDEQATGTIMEACIPPQRLVEIDQLMAALAPYEPVEPCWYLPTIGVDPVSQGQGLGSQLLSHQLQTLDKLRQPAYLESSNPMNVSFYQNHGFTVLAQVQIETSPLVTPMIRYPNETA